MTRLQCNVTACASNKSRYCCRPNIHVGGATASTARDTSCQSYTPLRSGTTNSTVDYDRKNPSMPVSCDAHNCMYNRHDLCDADSIRIQGGQAEDSIHTVCASFVKK